MTQSIQLPRETFAKQMAILARVVKHQPYMPILGSVLFKKSNEQIQLSVTDLSMAVTIQMEHQAAGDVKIALPARSLAALTSSVEGAEVLLEVGEKPEAAITCGNYHGLIRGQRAMEFPEVPLYDASTGWVMDAGWFRHLLEGVLFACGEDPNRPVLAGVLFEMAPDTLTVVAADGFRIAIGSGETDGQQKKRTCILPATSLRELLRILESTHIEHLTLYFPTDESQVVFQVDGIQIVMRVVEGKYPDYRQIIPMTFATSCTVGTRYLSDLVKQISIIARDDSHAIRFQIEPSGKIQIRAQAEDVGTCKAELNSTLTGPGLEIAFNSKFLLQGLELIRSDNTLLGLNKHNTPVSITAQGDSTFRYILMPMHVDG